MEIYKMYSIKVQQNLTRSFVAKSLAVRKVTTNKGKNTPGIDGVTYNTKSEKLAAVHSVKNVKNYKAQPVRRVYILKPDERKRLLGIPTLKARVVQTLFYYAFDPIAEETTDSRSYGFRIHRGVNDYATYLNLVLSFYRATRSYILDAGIEGFFDSVRHKNGF